MNERENAVSASAPFRVGHRSVNEEIWGALLKVKFTISALLLRAQIVIFVFSDSGQSVFNKNKNNNNHNDHITTTTTTSHSNDFVVDGHTLEIHSVRRPQNKKKKL